MTTDQLFKELEKTGKSYFITYYSQVGKYIVNWQNHNIGFSEKSLQKALKKLYDYAKKEGLIK